MRRNPGIDLVRVQDVGLSGADDPAVLTFAAEQGRVLLTHDIITLVGHAYQRVDAGLPMPGVLEVRRSLPTRAIIEDLLLIAECSEPADWEGQVRYLPL